MNHLLYLPFGHEQTQAFITPLRSTNFSAVNPYHKVEAFSPRRDGW